MGYKTEEVSCETSSLTNYRMKTTIATHTLNTWKKGLRIVVRRKKSEIGHIDLAGRFRNIFSATLFEGNGKGLGGLGFLQFI